MGSKLAKQLKQNETKKNPFIQGAQFREDQISPELSETIPDNLVDIETQILKLQDKINLCGWLIGKRLIVIRDQHLKETPFQNISEYAEDKFEISSKTAYNLMFIAENYDRQQAEKYQSKLYYLKQLDESKRKQYLEWIENDNPSARDIQEKIKSEKNKVIKKFENIHIGKGSTITVNLKEFQLKRIKKDQVENFKKDLEFLLKKYGE